jgi:hypothetical protein
MAQLRLPYTPRTPPVVRYLRAPEPPSISPEEEEMRNVSVPAFGASRSGLLPLGPARHMPGRPAGVLVQRERDFGLMAYSER